MLIPKQIVALGKIVSKVASRLASSTVRIERHEGGPRAMATDGRRAVVFSWDEPAAAQFPAVEGLSAAPARHFAANVPAKTLKDAGRGVARRPGSAVLDHLLLDESDSAIVQLAAASKGNITKAQAARDDAVFPDCQSVIPAPGRDRTVYDPQRHGTAAFTHTRIGVNAKQFAETIRVVSDLAADDPSNTVVMTVPLDPRRPLRLDARCTGRRAAAAVMPVSAEFSAYDEQGESERQPARRIPARPVPPVVPAAKPGEVGTPASGNGPQPIRIKPRRRKTVAPPASP